MARPNIVAPKTVFDLMTLYSVGYQTISLDGESPIDTSAEDISYVHIRLLNIHNSWAETLRRALLGGVDDTNLIKLPAQWYPTIRPNLFCTSVELSGMTNSPKVESVSGSLFYVHEYVKADVVFSYPPWAYCIDSATNLPMSGSLILSESFDGTTQFLTVDPKGLFWSANDSQPLTKEESPGRIVRQGSWTVTIYKVPNIYDPVDFDVANVFAFSNTINKVAHYSHLYNRHFPPNTLLMDEPRINVTMSPWGLKQFDISFTMSMQPSDPPAGGFINASGWNLFYNSRALALNKDKPGPIYYNNSGTSYIPYTTFQPTDWSNWIPVVPPPPEPPP